METAPDPLPRTTGEIAAFIGAFERGTLPKARWTHAAHVLTGAWYVHTLGEDRAIARMRTAVSRYNLAVGGKNTPTSGYHETVTVFWIKALAAVHNATSAPDATAFALAAVERFGNNRTLHQSFYAFDIMASEHARAEWIAPGKPLDLANL